MTDVYKSEMSVTFAYLRGRLAGTGYKQSRRALEFTCEAHSGQTRKDGRPYIIHPLSMACDAIAYKGVTDEIIATILLHDVCEDRNIPLSALPVNDIVKHGIKLMTIKPLHGEVKSETKRRYYNELLDSKEAIVTKAFGRYFNLNDMEGVLSEEAIVKNIKEAHTLLMPTLK